MFIKKVQNVFHFRKVTPVILRKVISNRELSVTLKTNDQEQAKLLAERIARIISAIEIEYRFGLIDEKELINKIRGMGISCNRTQCSIEGEEKFNLGILYERFSKENAELGKWSLKTQREYKTSFNLFLKYYNEQRQPQLTHQFLLKYRAFLLKLPPNLNKNKVLKYKKLCVLADTVQAKTLSHRQINKYLVCLTSFFKWLEVHEYVKKNPAHNLLLPKTSVANQERSAFSKAEIEMICNRILKMQKVFAERPERFWVPLIGIYSGMRLGEICQLYIEDIKGESDILSFFINDRGDKRIKNRASERIVPVHPRLKELGLLNYLKRVGESSERLFPNLNNHSVNGYGHQLGKWFSTFNRKYITQDKKKTFHSIRHSVANELKQLQVPSEIISELLGHKLQSITMDRYGKRYRPSVLLEAMVKLGW